MNFLGIALTPPSLAGLLRMLFFTLTCVALVEIADQVTNAVWRSEGAMSFIIGGFSGFLIHECGASFARHGWRALVLLFACSGFIFASLSLTT
jgi:hypothetical protein